MTGLIFNKVLPVLHYYTLMLDVKQHISKHMECDFTRNLLSSMILTLCLESEQHRTDQKTTFSAEMLFISKNVFFCAV